MASQYNTSTDISNLIVQYFEKKALAESEFDNGTLKYGQNATIPEGNSSVINWHRWNKFDLASDLSQGSQGTPASGVSMDTTQVSATLAEFGAFVRVPNYSDAIRLDKAAKEVYIKFTEQARRTANRRILTAMANTSTGFTRMYAGGALNYGALNQTITNSDLQRAVNKIEKNYPPSGKIVALLDPFSKGSLMIDDADFRDLIKFSNLGIIKGNSLPEWAGAKFDRQDDPWRESSAGNEGTYAATGDIVSLIIFSEEAYGKVQLFGRTGLKPKWHVQNIDPTGAETTIGYRIPFASAVLKQEWGVLLKGKSATYSLDSSVS